MSLGEHLDELRRRLVFALIGIVPIFIISMVFGRELLEVLIAPVREALRAAQLPQALQQTTVLETFFVYFRISVIVTLLAGGPWIIYQLWKFVAPGLYAHERNFVYLLIPMSVVLTVMGVLFMYFVILPVVLKFFVEFGSSLGQPVAHTTPVPEGTALPMFPVLAGDPPDPQPGQVWINRELQAISTSFEGKVFRTELTRAPGIIQQYKISEWTDLFLSLCLAFAGGFQTPIVVLLLGWAGVIDRAFMKKYRRHAVLVVCVAAAILTPADPLSMGLMAVPMYLLYELGGVLFTLLPADRVAGRRNDEATDDDGGGGGGSAPPGEGDGSRYRDESDLGRKVRQLVPNSLQSAGLLKPGGDDDGARP